MNDSDFDLARHNTESLGEAVEILELILPLARGYAAANRVGSNDDYVRRAELFLTDFRDPSLYYSSQCQECGDFLNDHLDPPSQTPVYGHCARCCESFSKGE